MGSFDSSAMETFGLGFACHLLYEKSTSWKMSREDYSFIKIHREQEITERERIIQKYRKAERLVM